MLALRSLFVAITLAGYALAHPEPEPDTPFANHPEEIARRQLETNKRHVMARNCGAEIAAYQLERRQARERKARRQVASSTTSALAPHYSTIQNLTCITAPEVTEDEWVRQDLRESQTGTNLYLDIGVMDISTCKPASNVFVEIWACSAQGVYSGFGGSTSGGGGGGPGGGGGGGSSGKTNANNFLRGGYMANSNGVVELLTIYPGFYTGRTVHIHTMVHQNVQYHSNGTVISSSGGLRHIGQIFFDETWNNQVLAQTAYQNSGQSRTTNAQDSILAQANTQGYSAFAHIEKLGSSLSAGLLGYITIGIDSSASYRITTNNYWDPNFGS
ncbi:aromatic compound dioxygenase [Serendipita vermifera]|nr:aromatic compound dioxygenase [Serendipita vermifera]